jgi:hypothetical protein
MNMFIDYFLSAFAAIALIWIFIRSFQNSGKISSFFLVAKMRVFNWACIACFVYLVSFATIQPLLEMITRTWVETQEFKAGAAVRLNNKLFIADKKYTFVWQENGTNKIVTVTADVRENSNLAMDVISYVKRTPRIPSWVKKSNNATFTSDEEINYVVHIKEKP